MHLRSIRLENCKGYENETISFHPQITVLVGRNGSGKTTVIEGVLIALSSWIVAAGWLPASKQRIPGHFSHRVPDQDLVLELDVDGTLYRWTFGYPMSDAERARYQPHSLRDAIRDFERLPVLTGLTTARGWVRAFGISEPEHEVPSPPAAAVYVDLVPGPHHPFIGIIPWFRREENLENEARLQLDPSFRSPALQAVRQALHTLLSALENEPVEKPRISRLAPNGSPWSWAPEGVLVVDKGGRAQLVDRLSDGERELLLVAMDLARRLVLANPGRPDPLNGDGVVLIDEVELHLHPAWQRRVLPALMETFPNLQFIVTTHSPQVLGSVPSECVRLLDGFKVHDAPPTEGRDSNSLLEDVFGVPERSDDAREALDALAAKIDADDLDGARAALAELEARLTPVDPEVARLRDLVQFLAS